METLKERFIRRIEEIRKTDDIFKVKDLLEGFFKHHGFEVKGDKREPMMDMADFYVAMELAKGFDIDFYVSITSSKYPKIELDDFSKHSIDIRAKVLLEWLKENGWRVGICIVTCKECGHAQLYLPQADRVFENGIHAFVSMRRYAVKGNCNCDC